MPLVSKWMHNFWKSWFFLKDDDDDFFFFFLFFWKMNKAWSNAPSLRIDAWLFENLDIWGKDDFFFFLMDEAWPNAPSTTINVNFENSYCVGTFNKKKQFEWNKIKITKLGKTRTARMVVASKLKIDGDCWINEWSMSTSFKRFFPWAC